MTEQPHFDDEITVLTARQVVPLSRIDTRVRTKRRWFLSGAFAVAMLLGAASALISAYFRLRNVPDPEIQSASVLPVSSVFEETVESTPPVVQPVVQPVSHVVRERPKPKVRNTDVPDDPRLGEGEALKRIRDAVLVDQWQERRARRVERREERREKRRAQHHDRDLSNINEIFEGTRHP
jgi:hypothetical protein